MRSATGQKRSGKANDSADLFPEPKVPSTQSAVYRRRRPLKLTQPSEQRQPSEQLQPTEAQSSSVQACGSESVSHASDGPVLRRTCKTDAVPSSRKQAHLSLPLRPRDSPASPLEAGSFGYDAQLRLSQDAERVYWDPSRPDAELDRREPDARHGTMETAVVRSSEPAQHQDELFEYWLSNAAAKPVQAGAKEEETLLQCSALVDIEQRREPRQDKKAILFDHLAELQRRGRSESTNANEQQESQQHQQLGKPLRGMQPMHPSVATASGNKVTKCSSSNGSPTSPGACTGSKVAVGLEMDAVPTGAPLESSRQHAVVKTTGKTTSTNNSSLGLLSTSSNPSTLSHSKSEQTCRRLVLEAAQCPRGKLLRLLDAATGAISTCELCGQWATSPVVCGDVVNVVEGHWATELEGTVDDDHGYLILQPDMLVTGTRVAQSFACQRKVVLAAKLNSSVSSVAAMRGTMLHELFEIAVTKRLSTDEEYEQAISNVLAASMQALYSNDEDEQSARIYLRQHVKLVKSWICTYLRPGSALIDGNKINGVLHAEENIWSPQFGLKGKVDLSVNLQCVDTGSVCPAALELKTGRKNAGEHQAQVMLYSLLISQRYGVNVDTGLLLYLSSNLQEMGSVAHSRAAVMGILMQRNNIALHLRTTRGDSRCRNLPPMIMKSFQCGRCYQKESCMLFHKVLEGGTADTSGVQDIFDATIGNLSDRHVDYCRSQLQMIDDESADARLDHHEIWTQSASTRETTGLALGQLRVTNSDSQGRGSCLYHFSRCDEESHASHCESSLLPSTRIVSGDYVVVSLEWPRRQSGIATGFVQSINDNCVVVSLDTSLTPLAPSDEQPERGSALANRRWRLDKGELSTGSGWLRGNVARIFMDDQHMRRLRSLIIDLDSPQYGPAAPSYAHVERPPGPRLDGLNTEQSTAIDHVLAARDYALILGMPGTGKTTTIAQLVQVLVGRQKSVLLSSFTNAAVDNVLLKLKTNGQDFLRVGSMESVHEGIVEYTVDGTMFGHTPTSLTQLYNSATVVATTCMGTKHDIFRKRRFDYCIVDEASQISQSMCLGPLCCADVFVLVGDHYQLPPLVRSAGAQEKGMSISLFKRLCESHPQAVHQLCSQYRMNQSIMNLSSEFVYGGQLRCGTPEIASSVLHLPGWSSWSATKDCSHLWIKHALAPSSPVVFIDTDTIQAAEDRSGDALQNATEASIVAEIVGTLVELGIDSDQLLANMVGIISPYRSQLGVIKAALQRQLQLQGYATSKADRVEVNTVDRYQGRDKDCIILSLVRSNRSQAVGDLLKDWRRINVAITRAKTKLIFVGSASTLRGSAIFNLLIESLTREGRMQHMPTTWVAQ